MANKMTNNKVSPELQKITRIMCLEKGTCSADATDYFVKKSWGSNNPPEVIFKEGFFKIYADFLDGKVNQETLVLLPHVHDICQLATLHPRFFLLTESVFYKPNPPLYLAKGKKSIHHRENKIATIKALQTLLDDGNISESDFPHDFKEVENTQKAAEMASTGETKFCITNQTGKDKYKLEIIQTLKQMDIFWFPFCLKN